MSAPELVQLNIDGKDLSVPKGTTIFNAAKSVGIDIPVLCHLPGIDPVAVCRVCAVDVGGRVFAAACIRQVDPGMKVKTNTEGVTQARKTLLELLLADHPTPCEKHKEQGSCELELLAAKDGVIPANNRFAPAPVIRKLDQSAANIAVNHNACILCDRCVRACTNVKQNFVIGRNGKGYQAQIGFDNDLPMGQSSCVSCGECMISCPTGALMNVGFEAHLEGEKVNTDWLSELSIFQGISPAFLQRNEGAVVKRNFKKGQIICKEGEFGNTAFYTLEGKVDIFISSPVQRATKKDTRGFFGIVRKMTNRLTHTGKEASDPESMKFIPIDAPVDLQLGNPTAQLGPGDLFGEMSAMSFYPRSATVRASEDCTLLEMLRPVLQILQKNPAFKREMDLKYKDRALGNQLRSMPIFNSLTPEFIDELRGKVELVRYEPGTVIFNEDDPADALYIVRIGFVKVSKQFAGGELTLAYLHRGTYFGEMGLLGEMIRTATCTALDHVEVVRIKAVDFNLMLERFPDVRTEFEKEIKNRQEQTKAITQVGQTSDATMRDFLDQGLMKAQSLLLLDLERCTRCDECVRACADAHDGITRLVRDGLHFDRFLVATACRSCTDPLCMVGCPVGSIRRRNSLEIIIEDWCVGCGLCAEQCPYGNINLHPFPTKEEEPGSPGQKKAAIRNKATVCDLCTEHEEPSCVYACPHDAAHRVNAQEFFTTHYLGMSKAGQK